VLAAMLMFGYVVFRLPSVSSEPTPHIAPAE